MLADDLQLLDQVIGDERTRLTGRASVPASPDIQDPALRFFAEQLQPRNLSQALDQPETKRPEIKDPELAFFAEQLKPRTITPLPPLPPIIEV